MRVEGRLLNLQIFEESLDLTVRGKIFSGGGGENKILEWFAGEKQHTHNHFEEGHHISTSLVLGWSVGYRIE